MNQAIAISAVALLLSASAFAEEPRSAPLTAWEALESMPPRTSFEIGLHMSFGTIGFWRDETPPWVGFGLQGGGGRVFATGDRLGATLGASMEGPVPLYYSVSVEPQATWDRVRRRVQLGVSLGPSFLFHSKLEVAGPENHFGVAPMLSFRGGYSENWSRMGRRFFALLQPKARWIAGGPDLSVSLLIGSGRGY